MSWTDTISRASFRGVPFYVATAESPKGRRLIKHVFPGRDTPQFDDMGRKDHTFTIDGYVIGNDYVAQMQTLEAAAEAPGAGELIHPVYGSLTVRCEDITPRYNQQQGRVLWFSLRLHEDNPDTTGRISIDTSAAVREIAEDSQVAANEEFLTTFSVSGTPSHFLDKVVDAAILLVKTINNTRLDVSGLPQVQFLYNAFARNPLDIIRSPKNMVDMMIGVITAVSDTVTPFMRLKSSIGLINKAEILLNQERVSITPDTNTTAMLEYVVQTAIIDAANAASTAEYPTYDDALSVRVEIGDAIDRASEYVADEIYELLYRLRAAVIRDIDTRSIDAPRIMMHTAPATLPSIVLAYSLYGDVSRAEEIVRRNGIEHPGFVPGGIPLEVLSS